MSGTVWMFSDQIDDEDIDFMREFPVMMAKHFAASVSVQRKQSRTTAKLSAPALTKDMAGCCAPATVK